MRRKLSVIAALLLGISTLLVLGVGLAHAQNISAGDDLSVPTNKTIDGTYFAAGRNIDIGGTVNGDVICGTQTLDISGTVNGDVLCGAQTVTITGRVDGDVRVAAQTVTLSGPVTGSVSVASQKLDIGSKATVGRDVSFVGTSLTNNGSVGRDIVGVMDSATIAGTVGRNMTATVDKLTISEGANVSGTVNYTSHNKASVASAAQVGSIKQSQPKEHEINTGLFKKWALLFSVLWTIAALFSSLILVLLIPRFFQATSDETLAQPGWTILAGLIGTIALPALMVLAFLTVIGIPLGIFLLLLEIMLSMLSFPIAAFYLGRWLFNRLLHWSDNAVALMLLGAVVLIILFWIPVIDVITWFLMVWIGFGSIRRAYRHRYARPDYHVPAEVSPVTVKAK